MAGSLEYESYLSVYHSTVHYSAHYTFPCNKEFYLLFRPGSHCHDGTTEYKGKNNHLEKYQINNI